MAKFTVYFKDKVIQSHIFESGVVRIGQDETNDLKEIVLPLLLLSAGSVFFLFGLVLFLFSSDGILTLEWNGHLWYAYFIISLPLTLFGWHTLQKFDNEN